MATSSFVSKTVSKHVRRVLHSDPMLPVKIAQVRRDVFGHAPNLNIRTGYQDTKKQLTGVYMTYQYPDFIEKAARKIIPGYRSELEDRRAERLEEYRRTGRGPPKKGSGSRKKKKRR